MTTQCDVRYSDHGSVVRVEALTPEAAAWFDEFVGEVEGWQGSRYSFATDRRLAFELLHAAGNAGLSVEP